MEHVPKQKEEKKHIIRVFLGCVFILCMFCGVSGHGMLIDPPQRSSMWRMGFSTRTNYDDNSLNCGGKDNQWVTNQGRCGACGDPYQHIPRDNEPGGRYYSNTIGRVYNPGDVINIHVRLTANHGGHFEFRLCDNGTLAGDDLFACFGTNVLPLDLGSLGTAMNYTVEPDDNMINLTARLPAGLTCEYCALQWKYVTGNSWGQDERGVGLGHGPQEQFINCANIRIMSGPIPTTSPASTTTKDPTRCRAVGPLALNPGMDEWCVLNCAGDNCPPTICECPS